MRIAIVSDVHGNLTALEAVIADLQQTTPDLILHGGDLADAGARPVESLDRIRELGWRGVAGNTDEMLFRPESLEEFAGNSLAPPSLWAAMREMAKATRAMLGEERIEWLRGLPTVQIEGAMALVHASPENLWHAPTLEATDAELRSVYGALGQPIVTYGHIHRPFVRRFPSSQSREIILANSGSVGLSYDGDCRASYLLLDSGNVTIRRVEYDVEKELQVLSTGDLPHADWIARTLRAAFPQMP
jgi:predicted phosphodiesterase